MAYDGLVVSATVTEFRTQLIGGRISKITQPERDEIQLTVRNQRDNCKVQISVNPSLPLCTLTEETKAAPITAPAFCMSLRKHIGNGTILDVRQPDQQLQQDGLERVIIFTIEHMDEMGDLGRRELAVELMGKYSNIILLREDHTILDSIRHISASQSSVREVLPNRPYFIPDAGGKKNPLTLSEEDFCTLLAARPEPSFQAIFRQITGLSPLTASELCHRASVDPDLPANCQPKEALALLYRSFRSLISEVVLERHPQPVILYKDGLPSDFSAFPLRLYEGDGHFEEEHFASMSEVIRRFYAERDRSTRIHQRSNDLRKVLNTLTERTAKKLAIQEKQRKDTEDMDKYRIYGELLHTYGYSLQGGEDRLVCDNYYTGTEITIPLKKDMSAAENAKHYLEKYQKQKRTRENVSIQLEETKKELAHLDSIKTALDIAQSEEDLQDIRREMMEYGFLHKSAGKGKNKLQRKSKPYHWVSSDGFELYIGKNNYQNEEVSFKLADGGDLWFHTKGVTGSHVIVKTGGQPMEHLPDRVFIEAATLAAYFSSQRSTPKVEVDYTIRKNLRKVPNQAPGFVIYHTNWSVTVEPRNLLEESR